MSPAVPPDQPLSKQPVPDLSARAPRPQAVRLRRSVVQVVVLAGAGLLSGSLAWAFVVQPQLRADARERAAQERPDEARGAVRASETVTEQPASYDRLADRLPEPRSLRDQAEPAARPAASDPRVSQPVYSPASPSAAPPEGRRRAVAQDAAGSGLFFGNGATAGDGQGAPPAPSGADRDQASVYNRHGLAAPLSPYELKAGAIVPAALLTGVDTARSGPVVATVTQNVFDTVSGRFLLLPQGTRLIGRHEGESAHGDRRAFLVWERLILPNGKSLILEAQPGVDAQGAVGVRGQVDRRLVPLAVATLFAGAITTLGQIARDDRDAGGLIGDVGDAAAIEGARVGAGLIDRELQVRPSIRLRAGAPVRVLITRDLILEPYRS